MELLRQLLSDPVAFYQANQLLVAQCGVNALLALSLWVTLFSGQLTLANVGFMAVGGYTAVLLAIHLHAPLALGAAAGVGLAMLASLLIGLPVLRLRGVFLAIATIGFGEALRFGVILNLPITGQGQGLTNPGASPAGGIPLVWVSVAVLLWVCWRLPRTRAGQAWAAIREDELAAASGGIDVAHYKLAAFVLGGAMAGYAGAVDANLNFFIDPTEYGANRAVLVLVFAVLGGIGSAWGPVLGAAVLTVLPEVVRGAASWRDVAAGIVLILVVVFRPEGMIGRRPGESRRRRRRPGPDGDGRAVEGAAVAGS